jgi:hypothetical protein
VPPALSGILPARRVGAGFPLEEKEGPMTGFGLARRLDASGSLSPEGAVLGTAGYLAPESHLGRPTDPAREIILAPGAALSLASR